MLHTVIVCACQEMPIYAENLYSVYRMCQYMFLHDRKIILCHAIYTNKRNVCVMVRKAILIYHILSTMNAHKVYFYTNSKQI